MDRPIHGIYSLTHDRLPNPEAAARPYLSGLSVRAYWNRFEPEEGRYDWRLFDETLALAAAHGKRAAFRVMNGTGTPEWVYAAGAAAYNPRDRGVTRLPLPWDEVFLARWSAFVQALGQRYDGHPDVAYAAMSMPAGRWAELLFPVALPSHPAYRYERYITAHYRAIDAYAAAFPSTPLTLALTGHEYDGSLQQVGHDLTEYLLSRFGPDSSRVYVQANGWSERVVMGRNATVDRTFDRCWAKPIRRGFQQIAGDAWRFRTPPDVRLGDQFLANAVLLRYGGQYAEVYEEDVHFEPAQSSLRQLQDLLVRQARIDATGWLIAEGVDTVRYTVDKSDPVTSSTAVALGGTLPTAALRLTQAAYVRYAAYEAGRVVIGGGYPHFGCTTYDPAAATITHPGAERLRYTADGTYPVSVRPEWARSPSAVTVDGDTLHVGDLLESVVRLVPIVYREDGKEITGDVYEVSLAPSVSTEAFQASSSQPAAGARWLIPPLAAVETVSGPDPLP
jgi:hypothetical protein